MDEFAPLDDGELDRLGDEELVAYVVSARSAGNPEAGKRAISILAFRLQPLIEGRVAAKVAPESRDDVVMETLESFLRSAFDGKVIDSVRAFTATIAKRRIADHYRRRERDPGQDPLPLENAGDDDVWGVDPVAEDESGTVEFLDAVERVLAQRSDSHRRIIELYGPEAMNGMNLSGAEVVEAMAKGGETVSVANVQKIWSRFKADLQRELSIGEHGEDPDG